MRALLNISDISLQILSTFLHQLLLRGPRLSFCLKFYLISQHFIHINGSLPMPSLPGTVPSRMSRPPFLPSHREGWCGSQPGQSLGWEARQDPFAWPCQGVSSWLDLFPVSQPWCSCFSLSPSSGQPWLKVNKTKQRWCGVVLGRKRLLP